MFFNTKKYSQDVEKNRQHSQKEPSMFNMISLGLLASFAPTRPLLRLHPHKIIDYAQREESCEEQVPIIYLHGFRGGDYTTRVMVKQALKDKGSDRFLKVQADLWGNVILSGCWTGDAHPIVQVAFRQRIVGIYGIDYYLSFVLPLLAQHFNFRYYDAVAHSLSAPCVIRTEMKKSRKKSFPHLKKCALIAGPFNGVTYLGDIPNVNALNEKGKPFIWNPHYWYLYLHRKRFDSHISVLNIYGNILDNSNTDKFISVVSTKSIRYILQTSVRFFQEVEIRGQDAEHSWMHDNPFVINIVDHFLGIKEN